MTKPPQITGAGDLFPLQTTIEARFRWLEAEINVVKPRVVVALGATAHPSALLRAPDEETRGRRS